MDFYKKFSGGYCNQDIRLKDEIKQYIASKQSLKDTFYIFFDLTESGKKFENQPLNRILKLYLELNIGDRELEYKLN